MPDVSAESARRRTFAIISHPDAGKTTLTQGLGAGLGVRGPITSPTFVIARVHPSLVGGPALVHVDAYRLGDAVELEDLERLVDDLLVDLVREVVLQGAAVDLPLAGAGDQADASDSLLAAAGALAGDVQRMQHAGATGTLSAACLALADADTLRRVRGDGLAPIGGGGP